tara:strand:- start:15452 stop:15613 length:162 start_codon:yes stop_codon:yes gene_type:complete
MTAKKTTTTNLRYESDEVHSYVKEMSEYYSNSDNGTINFCIKEQYKVFKAKNG